MFIPPDWVDGDKYYCRKLFDVEIVETVHFDAFVIYIA